MKHYEGRLAVQQRVLPVYRALFFDLLAERCARGLDLFAGLPRQSEAIATTTDLRTARLAQAKNLHLLGGPLYLCYQRGLLDWLERTNPDALILEANPRYLASPPAARWLRDHARAERSRSARPVLGWGLGSPPPLGLFAGIRRNARLRFLLQFDALIAYSARGADQYAALGFPRERIFVAPNAAAPAPKHPLPPRSDRFDGPPLVLYVGRLQSRKRLDLLIRASAALPADLQPRLRLVGDGPERSALGALAAELYPATEFAGAQFGADLAAHFAAADLFVLPGTGGLAVQDAMSYGLPVIVAQGDGTQDDLVRSNNGWQVRPDDFEPLLAAMRDALEDVPRLRAMGAESYRIVKEEVNLEKMVEAFVGALNAVSWGVAK
jgi:glycosyltransferase involved in cell wall biosynthesis